MDMIYLNHLIKCQINVKTHQVDNHLENGTAMYLNFWISIILL